MTTQDGIILHGECVVIPKSLQKEMLDIIHRSHLGIEKCKLRARDTIFWPGMNSQIDDIVSRCQICTEEATPRNHSYPTTSHNVFGRRLVQTYSRSTRSTTLLVDYYSGFIEVEHIQGETTSNKIIELCKSQFSQHGIPDTLISDNRPQFSSRLFQAFADKYQFQHITSSPHYPQSNGRAEKVVQTIKSLIKKATDDGQEAQDIYLALLDLRNTPVDNRAGSPSQRLRTKTLLPTTDNLLPKTIEPPVVKKQLAKQNRNTITTNMQNPIQH